MYESTLDLNGIKNMLIQSIKQFYQYYPHLDYLYILSVTGCIIATVAVVVSDLFGSKLLSEAYGLSIFGRAPGNLSGPPFSGKSIYLFNYVVKILQGLSTVMPTTD